LVPAIIAVTTPKRDAITVPRLDGSAARPARSDSPPRISDSIDAMNKAPATNINIDGLSVIEKMPVSRRPTPAVRTIRWFEPDGDGACEYAHRNHDLQGRVCLWARAAVALVSQREKRRQADSEKKRRYGANGKVWPHCGDAPRTT
jgi:hypothetical protein